MKPSLVALFAGLGALNAFLSIAAGAFGAHALRQRLTPDVLAVFETGARYHMSAALGLFVVAWSASRDVPHASAAGVLMLAGILLFSGSLYVLALSGQRALGMITPLGGLAFLVAWGLLAFGWFRLAR